MVSGIDSLFDEEPKVAGHVTLDQAASRGEKGQFCPHADKYYIVLSIRFGWTLQL